MAAARRRGPSRSGRRARGQRSTAAPADEAATPAEAAVAAALPPTGADRKILLLALGLLLVLGTLLFDPRLFTGGDNVVYYLLAKALAGGQGYVTLYEPSTPPHTLYPPGYPVLLVPVFWLAGGSLWVAKALSLAAALAATFLFARYLRSRLGRGLDTPPILAFALLLTAANATFLSLSHETLTEMPFLVVSAGALLLAEERRPGAPRWIAAALLAAAGYLIRTAALPLCIAVVWGVWRSAGRRAGLVSAVICLAAIGGWAARNAIVAPGTPGYVGQLLLVDPYHPALGTLTAASLLERVVLNLRQYGFVELPRLFWPFFPSLGGSQTVGAPLGTLLAILCATGFWRQVRERGLRAGEVYVVLYLALLVVWPWNGDRFLLPIVPLILSYLGLGTVALAGLAAARRRSGPASSRTRAWRPASPTRSSHRHLVTALIVLVLAPSLAHAVRAVPEQLDVTRRHLAGDRFAGYRWYERDFFAANAWIRRNAPPDAVVVSRKPQFTYFFAERKSFLYPFGPPEAIEQAIVGAAADFVIFDHLGLSADAYLRPYFLAYDMAYAVAFVTGDPPTVVFQRIPS